MGGDPFLDFVHNTLLDGNVTNAFNEFANDWTSGQFKLDFAGGPQAEAALSGLMIALGVALVFLGCRMFKMTLFALVMTASTGLIYYIGVKKGAESRIMFPVAIIVGFFLGCLAIKLWKLALFAVGFCVGLVGYIVAKSMFPAAFVNPVVEYSVLLIPGIILGIASVMMERWWLLFATPILGAFLTIEGIDHFAHLDIDTFGTLAGTHECSSAQCYGIWSGTAAFAIIGMLVQYRYTAGFNHKSTVHKKERYVKQIDVV